MKLIKSTLLTAIVFCVAVITPAQSQEATKSSSVKFGDKVIVIPHPEGFEEGISQFESVKQYFTGMNSPHTETLLAHLSESDCKLLRSGSRPLLTLYTKVSVVKSQREVTASNADMSKIVAGSRKTEAVALDPNGPLLKSIEERAERLYLKERSAQVEIDFQEAQDLGEFDVRPEAHSNMVLMSYKMDRGGTQSITTSVGSMTWLKVGQRIIHISVYHKISSPAALKTELRPAVIEVKRFTTKWVNEILAANAEKQ